MKELSIEEKAKRYDEVVAMAKECITHIPDEAVNKYMLNIFPELEVSDDERIREEIEQFLKLHNVLNKEWLDWIGKQGKETSWKPSKEEMDALYGIEDGVRRRSTIQVLEYARSLDTYNQYGKADIDKNISWLEKQGEQRFTWSEEQIKVCQEVYADILSAKGFDLATINSELKRLNEQFKSAIALLKKQGKSESESLEEMVDNTNEVEPKFKVGDWVVTDLFNIVQIKAIDNGKYVLEDTMKFSISVDYADNCWHRWTIEDAKDGDVLVASDGSIFIYKNQRDNGVVHYIAVTPYNDLVINENDYSWDSKNVCHPATKDEQTILFERMKEAGYEWNKDKKELKKL